MLFNLSQGSGIVFFYLNSERIWPPTGLPRSWKASPARPNCCRSGGVYTVNIQTFILFSSLHDSRYLIFFFSFLYGVSESNVEQILHGLVGENSVFHQLFDFPEICFYVTLNKWIFLFVCSKGLVRSPITATLPQIGSRLYVTWGILWSFPEVS